MQHCSVYYYFEFRHICNYDAHLYTSVTHTITSATTPLHCCTIILAFLGDKHRIQNQNSLKETKAGGEASNWIRAVLSMRHVVRWLNKCTFHHERFFVLLTRSQAFSSSLSNCRSQSYHRYYCIDNDNMNTLYSRQHTSNFSIYKFNRKQIYIA